MAYGTPTDPVAGTVITVAYAQANILDPIRWLRLLTGNSDPPGSSYVVVSTSTSGTIWQKVPADALAAGVAVANLGYTPVARTGDNVSGDLVMALGAGISFGAPGTPGRLGDTAGFSFFRAANSILRIYDVLTTQVMLEIALAYTAVLGQIRAATGAIAGLLTAGSATVANDVAVGGVLTVTGAVGINGAQTNNSTLNVAGAITGNGTVEGVQLKSSMNDGVTTPIVINAAQAGVAVPNLKAAAAALADVATAAGTATTAGTATNALNLGGFAPSFYGLVNSASVADSTGTLSLTTTMQDIPGLSIAAPATGTYLVIGSAMGFAQVSGNQVTAQVAVAGSLVGAAQKVNQPQFGTVPDQSAYGGGIVMYAGAITAAQVVTLRAKSQASSTSTIDNGQLTLIRIA